MEALIVFVINSIAYVFSKIAIKFGWKLSFETCHGCMDCFYHMTRNIGLLLVHRQVRNGIVKFKTRVFTLKEHFLHCGLLTTLVVNTTLFVKIHYKLNMALHELVWLILYTFAWILAILMVVELVRHRKIQDRITQLHDDADLIMRQLGIHFDYRFAIVTFLLLVGLAYTNWIFIVTSFWIIRSETIYDLINFSIAFFIFIMLVTTSLIFYGGHIYICSVRFVLLNNFIEKEINEIDNDDVIYDEENPWPTTFNSSEITAKLRFISDIHMKHHELTKATMMSSSIFLIGFIHGVIVMTAIMLYFYFFKHILLIELLLIDLTSLAVCLFLAICSEVRKRQAKYTLTLMADWCMCSFDPEMISIRSAILMQASHENFEPVAGGVVPTDTKMLIFIVEISIAVVVFFIQFSV